MTFENRFKEPRKLTSRIFKKIFRDLLSWMFLTNIFKKFTITALVVLEKISLNIVIARAFFTSQDIRSGDISVVPRKTT